MELEFSQHILEKYSNTKFHDHLSNGILFFGPCIFNNEDKKINQQNSQINSGLIYY